MSFGAVLLKKGHRCSKATISGIKTYCLASWQNLIYTKQIKNIFVKILIFHHFVAIFLKKIKNLNLQKIDTYSPYMNFVICIIFYFTTAFFWAITFGNPSINDGMVLICNKHCGQWGKPKKGHNSGKKSKLKKTTFFKSY